MRIHAIQDSLKPEFSRTTNTEETHTEPKDTVPSTNHADTDDDHTPHADTCHTEDHEPSKEPDVVEDEAESPNRASASSKRPRSSVRAKNAEIRPETVHSVRTKNAEIRPETVRPTVRTTTAASTNRKTAPIPGTSNRPMPGR